MAGRAWRWPFIVEDKVTCRGNWGPLCGDLRIHADRHPGAVYEVVEERGDGRWIALRDSDGHLHSGYGHTYFRIAGDCGEHVPTFRGGEHGSWICARCDEPLPGPGETVTGQEQ